MGWGQREGWRHQAPGPVSVTLPHARPRPAAPGCPHPKSIRVQATYGTLNFERHCSEGPDHENHFSFHELVYSERISENSVMCWAPIGALWAQRWVEQEQRWCLVGETDVPADP